MTVIKKNPELSSEKNIFAAEVALRQADHPTARTLVSLLATSDLRRTDRARVAYLASRCELPLIALKLLRPFVRPTPRAPETPTPEEIIEYAFALMTLGAVREATALLKPNNTNPKSFLYAAYCSIRQWDYAAAIDSLKKYIALVENKSARDSASPYEMRVARVNLCAAFVVEHRFSEATALISPLIEEAVREKNKTLLGNLYEIHAQLCFFQKDFIHARKNLELSHTALGSASGSYSLFIQKWSALCEFYEKPAQKSPPPSFLKLRNEALKSESWEIVRDLDLHAALRSQNMSLFRQVYFGTRFEAYRTRILKQAVSEGIAVTLLESPRATHSYSDIAGSQNYKSQHVLEKTGIPLHSLEFRLIHFLCSDYYRPFTGTEIFEAVYSGEYFNPSSTPVKIRQLIKRARANPKIVRILEIKNKKSLYFLKPKVRIEHTLFISSHDHHLTQFHRLRDHFQDKPFSSQELASLFGLSQRSVQRMIKELQASKLIESKGKGRLTRYAVSRQQCHS